MIIKLDLSILANPGANFANVPRKQKFPTVDLLSVKDGRRDGGDNRIADDCQQISRAAAQRVYSTLANSANKKGRATRIVRRNAAII